jgi:septum formation protein
VLPAAVIQAYVASGDAFGKAGSYAIQSALAGWIAHIDGSHSSIMGLPLFETAQLLRGCGLPLAI